MKNLNKILVAVAMAPLGLLAFTNRTMASIFPLESTKTIEEGQVATYAEGAINALPTIIFVIAFILVFGFMFIILVKSLNPFTEDQEGKFKEGKSWFTRAGILILAPIIVFVVVIVVYSIMGFQNPFEAVKDGLDLSKLIPNWQ
jgi:flagellar biosynthesis protein FlhB